MKRTLQTILVTLISLLLSLSLFIGCAPDANTGEDDSSELSSSESNTPGETPFETPDSPESTPESTPAETPADTPAETPTETPTETPVETPVETPADTPTETPTETPPEEPTVSNRWTVGFASREIAIPQNPSTPLYIAGYNQGVEISGVLDLQRANAVWLDADDEAGGIIIISIDCVGLASGYVGEIRNRLADFADESGCSAINVVSTHTHAGLDTFGLWGPAGVDGKNPEFMENLVSAAVEAAKEAYADRSDGTLFYSKVRTSNMLRDSRLPTVMDPELYQLRFKPEDSSQNGIRVVVYGAHPESLRGANTLLSRDYPGEMSDLLKAETGDDMLFLPGPIGGLIMTKEFISPFNAVDNLKTTGKKLTDYLLSIEEEDETQVLSQLTFVKEALEVPVENGVFKLYKSLGILGNEIYTDSRGNVIVKSEINLISLGGKSGILFGLIPGEIFPELVRGVGLKATDPTPLNDLAAEAGYQNLITVNLANDELGYIVPPSDFIVHPTNPYFQRYEVNGEDHYEETNSVGKQCAAKIAEAFASALAKLNE